MLHFKMLCEGDLETTPDLTYELLKSVPGIFHQGHVMFGVTAGRQCACNALYSIAWSVVKRISQWKSFDLDHIIMSGDRISMLMSCQERSTCMVTS